jgi:GT2 family glycosyltransferase
MRHDLAHGVLSIQVDDPTFARLREVLALRAAHDTRVRINFKNIGASATRNAGLAECWAEVVLFLDDDVEPKSGALKALRDALAAHGKRTCCGAIGNVHFPPSLDVLHEATRMSQILIM